MKNRTIINYEFNKILLEAVEKELDKQQLNEGFGDWLEEHNPFSSKPGEKNSFFNGHLVLDVIGLVSGFVPVFGSTVSFGADAINAAWYFLEGEKFIAGLYILMAIPGVGDLLALPIQALLKGGTKALSKFIPIIPQLYKGRNLIKSFLARTIVMEEKIGVKGLSKATGDIFEKFFEIYEKEGAEKAGEYFAKNVDKDLIKNGGPAIAKVEKKEMEKAVEKVATTAEKKAAEVGTKAVWKGEQALIKRAILLGTKAAVVGGGGDNKKPTPGPAGGDGGYRGCKGGVGETCSDNELKWGCVGDNVKPIQQQLINCGYPLPKYGVDGRFCSETKGAVVNFQKDAGLNPNGIVDAETESALNSCRKGATSSPDEKKPEEKPLPKEDLVQPVLAGTPIQENYYLNPIKNRYENLEKLVFERMVKNANRL